jgi:nucleoside-diphosphate-sugar epimerase
MRTASPPRLEVRESPLPRCVITGVSGFLGGKLFAHFAAREFSPLGLTRNPARGGGERVAFDLDRPPAATFFREHGTQVLIHAAWDFSLTSWAAIERVNVGGSRMLIDAAREAGVAQLIFISTMSAFRGAKSMYGRAKLMVEDHVRRCGGTVLRPGLVYGQQAGGMMGTLEKLARTLPVIPDLPAAGKLYLVAIDDLCRVVEALVLGTINPPPAPAIVAHPEPMTFRDILSTMAASSDRSPRFIPVPWRAPWLAVRMLELVGVKSGMRSDSIVSLVNQDTTPAFDASFIASCGLRRFRDFHNR